WLSNNLQNEFAIVGWVNTKMFWETRDAAKSQGWTPLIVDTNGNGKRDAWVEPNAPDDPTKDRRIGLGLYGIAYSPADGSIWGSNIGHPGWVIRIQLGSNPSETALAEVYKVPPPGYGMRGFDVDRQGRAWVTLASGHIASFDRRTCKGRLNGPGAAEGNLCPEDRLEGPRIVGNLWQPNADAHRGHRRAESRRARQDSVQPARRAFPAASGSTRPLRAAAGASPRTLIPPAYLPSSNTLTTFRR